MSRFLMLICLALGLVVTGCGGEKKTEGDKGPTKKDEKGSAEKGSVAKEGDKKDGEKKDEKADEKGAAKAEEKKEEKAEEKAEEKKADDKGASTDKPAAAQLVSLKLPNMT